MPARLPAQLPRRAPSALARPSLASAFVTVALSSAVALLAGRLSQHPFLLSRITNTPTTTTTAHASWWFRLPHTPPSFSARLFHGSPRSSTMPANTANAPGWDPAATPYPKARRDEKAGTVYESKEAKDGKAWVPEPYEWLEKPPSQSAETKEWVQAQANLTQQYLKGFAPHAVIKKRLEDNFNYARFSCPSKKGDGAFYYSWNSGLDPQPTTYRATAEEVRAAKGGSGAFGTKWFDQSKLSKDGTVALSSSSFSKSGKLYAYGISHAGSDWVTVYVRSSDKPFVEAPADAVEAAKAGPDRLRDEVKHVKFSSIAWTHDDAGFFYQRYPTVDTGVADGTETDSNKNAALFYHWLGTDQADDVEVIKADPDEPMCMWGAEVSDDGNYLIIENHRSTERKARHFIAPLRSQPIGEHMRWIAVATKFEYQLSYIGNDERTFYFMTNKDASNWKVVKVELPGDKAAQECEHLGKLTGSLPTEDLVPEDPEALLSSVAIFGENKLLLVRSVAAKDEVWQYDLGTGRPLRRLMEGQVVSVSQMAGRREDHEVFVSTLSFTSPGSVTRLSWPEGSPTTTVADEEPNWRQTSVAGIRAEDFVSEQVFFESKDGTKVPMFITRPKDVAFDGTAPCWLYFYGGFAIPLNPFFSPGLMTFASMTRSVVAVVNARGGAEFGDRWHDAGRLLNKQNVFDDVLSAAEHLVTRKVAARGKIVVNGGSNGGLGAMAVGNQADPERHGIGAVVAEVGVHDLLKFWQFTIGAAWCADYGRPHEDPVAFDYNRRISPLHNVREDKIYPTVVLLTGDHDDRVVPAHTFKMLAELQHRLPNNPNPLLGRIDIDAGHGAGKSTQKRIEETADKYALVGKALGLSFDGAAAAPAKGPAL